MKKVNIIYKKVFNPFTRVLQKVEILDATFTEQDAASVRKLCELQTPHDKKELTEVLFETKAVQ